MKRTALAMFILLGTLLPTTLAAQQAPIAAAPAKQDPAVVRDVVERFLQTQTAGLPGQIVISTNGLDARANLVACANPEAFLPPGSRVWGRTTVGVRCTAPSRWTVYIPSTVKVFSDYLKTVSSLMQGQVITAADVVKANGDLTMLPSGVLTDPAQAIGRTVAIAVAAGGPLRQDALRNVQAVQQGQTVRLMSGGPGFRVSSEAKALSNAVEGQVIQARTNSGQIISGIAKAGGIVEVAF